MSQHPRDRIHTNKSSHDSLTHLQISGLRIRARVERKSPQQNCIELSLRVNNRLLLHNECRSLDCVAHTHTHATEDCSDPLVVDICVRGILFEIPLSSDSTRTPTHTLAHIATRTSISTRRCLIHWSSFHLTITIRRGPHRASLRGGYKSFND